MCHPEFALLHEKLLTDQLRDHFQNRKQIRFPSFYHWMKTEKRLDETETTMDESGRTPAGERVFGATRRKVDFQFSLHARWSDCARRTGKAVADDGTRGRERQAVGTFEWSTRDGGGGRDPRLVPVRELRRGPSPRPSTGSGSSRDPRLVTATVVLKPRRSGAGKLDVHARRSLSSHVRRGFPSPELGGSFAL